MDTSQPAINLRVHDIGSDFLSLEQALTESAYFAAQVAPKAAKDEFDRFKIWAGNIAAHRKGRRSLEYRLRDAGHLKDETHNLLTALDASLHKAIAITKGLDKPWDELSASDSDSDFSEDEEDGETTELKQVFASIKISTTCLFRLSMAIRDPAPDSQHYSTITVDKSYFEEHDIQHAKAKFPNCSTILAERLGRAVSGRRQYLAYREEHHQKLNKNIETIGFEAPRTEHTSNSTEATPIPQVRTNNFEVLDGDDALSQTSFATSINAAIRVPPLPRKAREEEHFECPLCFMIVSIHTTAGWKQHVYRDLHPYCCTFEDCTTADRLYDSRHAWFAHELEAHRTTWQCIDGCDKIFAIQSEFEQHVSRLHSELSSGNMLSALKRTATRGANLSERTSCPLCDMQLTVRALQRHIGRHQEQLALFALPSSVETTEDDAHDEEIESVDIDKWQDEDVSDISNENELDDLEEGLTFDNMNLAQLRTQYMQRKRHLIAQYGQTIPGVHVAQMRQLELVIAQCEQAQKNRYTSTFSITRAFSSWLSGDRGRAIADAYKVRIELTDTTVELNGQEDEVRACKARFLAIARDLEPDVPNDATHESVGKDSQPRATLQDGDKPADEHRSYLHFLNMGRRQDMQSENDTVLGPPKFNFTTATRRERMSQPEESRRSLESKDDIVLGPPKFNFARGEKRGRPKERK